MMGWNWLNLEQNFHHAQVGVDMPRDYHFENVVVNCCYYYGDDDDDFECEQDDF
jgi:hypothetical protein